jgi:hypothetical protein
MVARKKVYTYRYVNTFVNYETKSLLDRIEKLNKK